MRETDIDGERARGREREKKPKMKVKTSCHGCRWLISSARKSPKSAPHPLKLSLSLTYTPIFNFLHIKLLARAHTHKILNLSKVKIFRT